MKRIFALIAISAFCMQLSQAQEVRYKVKKDDPMDFKNFMLHLDPMMVDCYLTNITAGVAGRADYMVGKIFDISAQIRRPYWDMNEFFLSDNKSDGDDGYFSKNIKPTSYLEGTFQLHILDRVKPTNHRIVFYKSTSQSGNYQVTTTRFVDIPGSARKIMSLRGGAVWHNTAVDFDGAFNKENDFSIDTGSTMYLTSGGTMLRSMVVYGGLSTQTIANFKVLTDKYGMKYATPWNTFYVDFMFAPVLSLADVMNNKTLGPEFKVTNSNMKRTGWRLGYVMRNHKGTSMSVAYNMGVRPGIVGDGSFLAQRVFLDMNIGVSIPYKAQLIKPKKKA